MNVIQSKTKYSKLPIMFKDVKHHLFYKKCLEKTGKEGDVYHEALFYLLGLTEETRKHINQLFDFDEHCIIFEGFHKTWQTCTTLRICRLAFNLYDNCTGEETNEEPEGYTPYELFACENMQYMFEAIKIRYSEYCRHSHI